MRSIILKQFYRSKRMFFASFLESLWNMITRFFHRTIQPITPRKRPVSEINRTAASSLLQEKPSRANCSTRLCCLVSSWPLNSRSLESMKRPPYSLLLALQNARRTGRMSERDNCFPFLRKVNGPLVEITLQFRRLMEAAISGVAVCRTTT